MEKIYKAIDAAFAKAILQPNLYQLAAKKKIAKPTIAKWKRRGDAMTLDKKIEILLLAGWKVDMSLTEPTTIKKN